LTSPAKVIAGEQGGISKAVGWTGGGGFGFYRLGAPVFDADGRINAGIGFAALAAHIWFSEFLLPMNGTPTSPFLGVHAGKGLALLYNGILGDKRPAGGNVLTRATLATIRAAAGDFDGPLTIYGEASRIGAEALRVTGVTFKQTPYDVKAR
jgi:adenine-specific DNA-methyltransferase